MQKVLGLAFVFLFSISFALASTSVTDELINTTGNVSASYFVGDGSYLTGVSGDNSSWNQTYADTLYADISVTGGNASWNESYADTLYAAIGSGSDNVSWNESYADTLYSDISWGYNQTAPANIYTDSVNTSNYNWITSTFSTLSNLVANYYNKTYIDGLGLGASYILKYTTGNFNGSLYTTGADSSASDSNSIFQVIGDDGTPRMQIQNGGSDQASFIARSFMVVNQNNTRLNQSQNNLCSEWGFDFIDCNTSSTGADFGVQDDFEVQGLAYPREGIYGDTSDWGVYLLLGNHSPNGASGENGTFTDSLNYFCDYVSNPFTQEQVNEESWIKITNGEYEGAFTELKTFVNSSCVEVGNNPSWISNLENQKFVLESTPVFIISDGGFGEFYVGSDPQSKFKVAIRNGTGTTGFGVSDVAGAHQHGALRVKTDTNGFDGVVAFFSQVFSTSASESTDTSNALLEFIPNNFNNSHHKFIDARVSGEKNSEMIIDLFELQGDFNSYIKHGETESISRVYYDDGASTTDITSSATSSSSNVSIFENDNSILYIGGITNFTQITINLETTASASINGEFWYCNSSNEWDLYTGGVSDTTSGFTGSGSISADSPSDRGTCNKEIDGTLFADTNNYTYVAVKRTRNNLVTTPVELLFSVGGGSTSFILADDYIKLNGVSSPPITCDSSVDGAIYYDSDVKFHCSCKSGTGWVQMNDYSTACS